MAATFTFDDYVVGRLAGLGDSPDVVAKLRTLALDSVFWLPPLAAVLAGGSTLSSAALHRAVVHDGGLCSVLEDTFSRLAVFLHEIAVAGGLTNWLNAQHLGASSDPLHASLAVVVGSVPELQPQRDRWLLEGRAALRSSAFLSPPLVATLRCDAGTTVNGPQLAQASRADAFLAHRVASVYRELATTSGLDDRAFVRALTQAS